MDAVTSALLRTVETHLRDTGLAPTTFGRLAVKDPRFVFDLRNGRQPRHSTALRLQAYVSGAVSHPRTTKRLEWTPEQEARLIAIIAAGGSYNDAAAALGHSPAQLRKRATEFADEHFPDRAPYTRLPKLLREAGL